MLEFYFKSTTAERYAFCLKKKFRFQQLRDEMEANRIVKEPAYLIIKHLYRKYNRIYQESDTELLTYAFL